MAFWNCLESPHYTGKTIRRKRERALMTFWTGTNMFYCMERFFFIKSYHEVEQSCSWFLNSCFANWSSIILNIYLYICPLKSLSCKKHSCESLTQNWGFLYLHQNKFWKLFSENQLFLCWKIIIKTFQRIVPQTH